MRGSFRYWREEKESCCGGVRSRKIFTNRLGFLPIGAGIRR